MKKMHHRRFGIVAMLLAGADLSAVQAQQAPPDAALQKLHIHIAQQPIGRALTELGQQSGLTVIVPTAVARDVISPAIGGVFTANEVLLRILGPLGLQAEYLDAHTVAISATKPADHPLKKTSRESSAAAIPAVASDDAPSPQSTSGGSSDEMEKNDALRTAGKNEHRKDLEEVVVTGSHIRGEAPAGSKLIVIDRDYMEESGYATLQDMIKTLPQNFGGGVSEAGQSAASLDLTAANFNHGSAVNLRGLGADSTLILVNGRRQPLSGANGAFTDISGIAASAVERVEVLTDGASAIYGSDAVGGVVNFVLRKDYDGAESHVRVGTYDGDATETEFSQLFGKNWSTGNVLVGYQYLTRNQLRRADRTYTASADLRPFGGTDWRLPTANPGNIVDPDTFNPAYAIPKGQDGTHLTDAQLLPGVVNYNDGASQGQDLLPQQETHAAFLNVSQDIGSYVKLFAEGRYSSRHTVEMTGGDNEYLYVPSSNPYYVNPFEATSPGAVFVTYNLIDDLGNQRNHGTVKTGVGTVGATVQLPRGWEATISGSYGKEDSDWTYTNQPNFDALDAALSDSDPATAFNPFGDGSHTNPATLAAIRSFQINSAQSTDRGANLTADGAIVELPGGTARAAVGVDYYKDEVNGQTIATTRSEYRLGRDVTAVFAEAQIPVFGSRNAVPGITRLDLSVAGRHERYSDFGTTNNPKLGANWTVIDGFKLRGTWGTSFKAPRLIQLLSTAATNADAYETLQSPAGPVTALVRTGNNPGLKSESAHVWTAGFDWAPPQLNGLKASVTYFNIDYKDRIAPGGPTGNPTSVLQQADQWASVITRDPTPQQVAAVCNAGFLNNTTVDTCLASNPQIIADLRLLNLAELRVHGIDIDVGYTWQTSYGMVDVGATGTDTFHFDRAVTSAAPTTDVLNTLGNVVHVRARGRASWSIGGFNTSAFLNYTGSYVDNVSVPNRPIASWTTVDLSASYRFASSYRVLDKLQLGLNVVNVANRNPPFADVSFAGYDSANSNLYGRIISAQLTKAW